MPMVAGPVCWRWVVTSLMCKRRELLETARAELSERLTDGAELAEVLNKTASVVELSFPSLSCQILIPDEWGSLTLSGIGSWLPLRCRAADEQSGFTLMDIGGCIGAQHIQEVCLGGTDFSLHSEIGSFHDVVPCRVVPVLGGEGEVVCVFVVKGPEMPEAEIGAAPDAEEIYELVRNVVDRCRAVAGVGLESANDPLPRMSDRDVLAQNLASVLDWDCPLVLFIVALDNLHQVNDSLGRGAADRILKDSVRRLRLAMGETEFLAQTGNDELVVALRHIGDLPYVKRMAECMRRAVSGYYVLEDGGRLWTSVSVGVALYPDHGEEASELLSYANQALIAAKGGGYSRVRVFERSMQESTLMHRRLAKDLSVALREGQLSLHYQPIFDYVHEKICKAEALLRWRHPQLGEVSPALFIPIAEANGLIHEIGNWVFREAARVALEWNRRSESDVPHRICINRSPTQFFVEEDIKRWSECLAAQQIPGEYLSVEITGSLLLDDRHGVHEQLRQIRAMGMKVALDDFGTGYSALSYLKKFEIDYLKIDRSFIRGIVSDPRVWVIVESIITMARRLGIRLIAEGVETRDQAILLSQAGCDMAQGYLYARPMPEREFLEFSSVWPRQGH
jgi:diguanylate cyclase (GGDEF)-like protein